MSDFAKEIEANIRAIQAADAASRLIGDETGECNRALREIIDDVRGALAEMDDLADEKLPREVVFMRQRCRQAIAKGRKLIEQIDAKRRREMDEFKAMDERAWGWKERE